MPFFSVVTMICDDFKISGENDGKTMVCNSLRAMERGIGILCARYPIMIDDVKKRAIYEYIEEKQHSGKEARWEHKQNVIAYKEKLEEKRGQKICPYCKTALVLRKGKYGEFYGCSNYPKCRYTMKKSESGVNE